MGMKLFVKLMMLFVVLALAAPFFLKGPDGQPLLTLDKAKATASDSLDDLKGQWDDVTDSAARAAGDENAGKVAVHRWQDENGQWHYSNEAPVGGQAETVYVDPDINLMDPVEIKRRSKTRDSKPAISHPGIITPGRAKEALDEATGVRDQLNERNADMKRRLDETG